MERILVVVEFVLFLEPALLIFVGSVDPVPPTARLYSEPVLNTGELAPWHHESVSLLSRDQSPHSVVF